MRSVLALCLFMTMCVSVQAVSLQEAVRMAVQTNPRIDAAMASYRASESKLDQAEGRFFPEVEFDSNFGVQRINRPNGLGPAVNDRGRLPREARISIRQVLFGRLGSGK